MAFSLPSSQSLLKVPSSATGSALILLDKNMFLPPNVPKRKPTYSTQVFRVHHRHTHHHGSRQQRLLKQVYTSDCYLLFMLVCLLQAEVHCTCGSHLPLCLEQGTILCKICDVQLTHSLKLNHFRGFSTQKLKVSVAHYEYTRLIVTESQLYLCFTKAKGCPMPPPVFPHANITTHPVPHSKGSRVEYTCMDGYECDGCSTSVLCDKDPSLGYRWSGNFTCKSK